MEEWQGLDMPQVTLSQRHWSELDRPSALEVSSPSKHLTGTKGALQPPHPTIGTHRIHQTCRRLSKKSSDRRPAISDPPPIPSTMPSLRLTPCLQTTTKAFQTSARVPSTTLIQRRFASGDYGSGTGDPVGEKPQEQGPNPSEKLEHPGPPPPKTSDKGGNGQGGKEGGEKKG